MFYCFFQVFKDWTLAVGKQKQASQLFSIEIITEFSTLPVKSFWISCYPKILLQYFSNFAPFELPFQLLFQLSALYFLLSKNHSSALFLLSFILSFLLSLLKKDFEIFWYIFWFVLIIKYNIIYIYISLYFMVYIYVYIFICLIIYNYFFYFFKIFNIFQHISTYLLNTQPN